LFKLVMFMTIYDQVKNRRSYAVLGAVALLLAPTAAFAKMGMVPLLVFGCLASSRPSASWPIIWKTLTDWPLRLVGVLALWALVSLTWAPSPNPFTIISVVTVGFLCVVFVTATSQLSDNDTKSLQSLALLGGCLLIALLAEEHFTNAAILRAARPEDALPRTGEWVPYLRLVAARGTSILAPLTFVLALLAYQKTTNPLAWALLIFCSLTVSWLLPMQASTLAIVIGLVVFALVYFQPRFTIIIITIGIIIYALLSPFLSAGLLTIGFLEDMGLDPSRNLRQRLAIWEYVSSLIGDHPICGHGFDSSRALGATGVKLADTGWDALPLHPHNAFLQIWLELGGVGILIACMIVASIAHSLLRLAGKPLVAATHSATIAAIGVIALVSYGAWQHWWIATWGIVWGYLVLARKNSPSDFHSAKIDKNQPMSAGIK